MPSCAPAFRHFSAAASHPASSAFCSGAFSLTRQAKAPTKVSPAPVVSIGVMFCEGAWKRAPSDAKAKRPPGPRSPRRSARRLSPVRRPPLRNQPISVADRGGGIERLVLVDDEIVRCVKQSRSMPPVICSGTGAKFQMTMPDAAFVRRATASDCCERHFHLQHQHGVGGQERRRHIGGAVRPCWRRSRP